MSGMPPLQQIVYPSSAESERNACMRLCVLHNLYFYNHMMEEIREAIEQGRYKEYKRQKLDGMEAGE